MTNHPFPTLRDRSAAGGGIYIGSSYWRDVEAGHMGAMMSLVAMCNQLGIRMQYAPVVNDGLLTRSRSRAASAFLESQMDILVMVDSDIEFNPYQLLQMCESTYEAKLVGGAYPKRSGHQPALAIRIRKPEMGNREIYWNDGALLAEVEYLATGFMTVHREVLEKIRDDLGLKLQHQTTMRFYEFFGLQTVDKDGEEFHLSEDWAFCQRAVDVGYTCYVDPRVRLIHWGLYDFTMEDVIRQPRPEPGVVGWHYQDGREGFGYAALPWVVKTKDGFKMHLDREDRMISAQIAATGEWEPEVAQAIREHVGAGTTFLDLGANLGYFSLLAAHLGGRVLAIEPNPKPLKYFESSMVENPEMDIMARQVAVGLDFQKASLRVNHLQNQGEAYLAGEGQGDIEVSIEPVKNLISPLPKDFVIKMDIEGEEYNAILGSPEVFRNAKVIIFEVSEHQLQRNSQVDAKTLLAWFTDNGFQLSKLSSHPTYADWMAVRVE